MNELNNHGDGFEEYYYSKDRASVPDEDLINDDMEKLGYTDHLVDFEVGRAVFSQIIDDAQYRISIDLFRGHCSKIKHGDIETPIHISLYGGMMVPFTDAERYLIFKLMDEYDKKEGATNDEF